MTTLNINEQISQVVDKITTFLMIDLQIGKDFKDFAQFDAKYISQEEKRSRTLTYLYSRKIGGKTMFDYYADKHLNLSKGELAIVNALKNAFVGVFQIKKVLKHGFELYSIINERDYSVNALGTMTAFRGISQGAFLYACLCKIDGVYYLCDVRAMTSADKIGGAKRYAISKIIDNPEITYFQNDEKLNDVKKEVAVFYEKFVECFKTTEIITTNQTADEIINAFNSYCEYGDEDIKTIVQNGIAAPEKYEYFPTKDFNYTNDSIEKKSMAGFSAQGSKHDVGIIYIEKSGLYAIPFYGTFCKIFESDDYKQIKNCHDCVRNFVFNEKISGVIFVHLAEKYENFISRINEILNSKYTLADILINIKHYDKSAPNLSPAALLYASDVFADFMFENSQQNNNGQNSNNKRVGRNEPCPCGSGKKYKKCCMPKE